MIHPYRRSHPGKHADELAQLESLDNGKTGGAWRVFADVALSADLFHYMSGWGDQDRRQAHLDFQSGVAPENISPTPGRSRSGLVGQIIPWNFPLLMAAWKLGPALATGCHRGC